MSPIAASIAPGPRRRLALLALLALLTGVLALALATRASGLILPATTIDGPSQDIVGFGGVAMAEDGTGGAVYLKRVEGVTHLFVSRYIDGTWSPPIRVDTEEPFSASWPRIGAADDGELIVVWATPYATREGKPVYELLGSELGPGGEQFGKAVFIDSNIEEATGTDPDLAVSSTGQADVVYRVVEPKVANIALLHPGDVVEQVRLAHFDGTRWSNLGEINRNPSSSMRPPTQVNAPVVAIGPTGNGIVVWQEPDVEGVARIWARRLFGSAVDYVMPVSATSYDGKPIASDAEAPAVAFSRLGQAEVAYRQPAGEGSALPGTRVFLDTLPDGESVNGGEFEGAQPVDEGPGGPLTTVGPPSVDVDEQREVSVLYDANGTPRMLQSKPGPTQLTAMSLGPPFAGAEPFAASVMNPQGGGVSAWPSEESPGHPAVAVREDFPNGAVQTALVSGGAGGQVGELSLGRSGLGDGIIGFRQGQFGDASIVVAQATAPPAPFVITVPKIWVKPAQAVVSWLPAPSAEYPLTYSIVLDGHIEPIRQGFFLRAKLDPRGLSSGRHRLQILATDRNGQGSLSAPSELLIANTPPSVRISAGARKPTVAVVVTDHYDGVDKESVRVDFGDGHSAHGGARLSHTYARPGVYLVTVSASDNIGNAGTVHRWVEVQ